MSTPTDGTAPPDAGNLWDGDHNSEGFRFLAKTSADFATYLNHYLMWLHGNALAGKTPEAQDEIGARLEFVAAAMRAQAALRIAARNDFGVTILERLARLENGERIDLRELVADDGDDVVTDMVKLALDDYVRTELVDVKRARPGRIGQPRPADTYALTPMGRAVVAGTAVTGGSANRTAMGGNP